MTKHYFKQAENSRKVMLVDEHGNEHLFAVTSASKRTHEQQLADAKQIVEALNAQLVAEADASLPLGA